MKFVVDANILFSLSKPGTSINTLKSILSLELIAPDFALTELKKYKEKISKKAGQPFNKIIKSLKEKVIFVNKSEYSDLIKKLKDKISNEKDLPYLALASKMNLPIWSMDPHLKQQSEIKVYTTSELASLLE